MKNFFLLVMMISGLCSAAANGSETAIAPGPAETIWFENFEKAKAEAKRLGRPLLLDFTGSDWCGWCVKLKAEVFVQEPFLAFAKEHLILVELDFPRRKTLDAELTRQNEALADLYSVSSYPTVLLIDADGKVLGSTGYLLGGPRSYVRELKRIIGEGKPAS